MAAESVGQPEKFAAYTRERRRFWDQLAQELDRWLGVLGYYQERLAEVYRFLIPPGARVLEIGCGQADLLAALRPSVGVGVDFSAGMLDRARARHPNLELVQQDAHDLDLAQTFDYVICSDLINELWDVQQVFERIRPHCTPSTRVILNTYSRIWELPRRIGERLGLFRPQMQQNWLLPSDVSNMLYLAGFEVIRQRAEILWPFRTPLLAPLCNRYLVRLKPFQWFAFKYFLMARPKPEPRRDGEARVSVVVPARNEQGNIESILDRVPQMGAGTELIFVEGNSTDRTYETIREALLRRPEWNARLFRQPGKGKGDAVRKGFAEATGDVFMILDADLTVAPEDLPRFYQAWRDGYAEFVNGVRLVYPAEDEAFRFWNVVGNRFFSLAFTWLLGQPVKDTLCGTKVLSRRDYETIAANREYFGDLDPFGDFDLLFGAAKYNLKIVDLPVRYAARTYGETNIQRWRHGWILLKMVVKALRRIQFV
jgi:SAM-dependent methyltransferase